MRKPPAHVLTLAALIAGIAAGGLWPSALAPVAAGTRAVLSVLVLIAPFLIIGALSPAIAMLIRRGLAGKFAAAVLAWFVASAITGSILGALVAAVIFRLPISEPGGALMSASHMLQNLAGGWRASGPIVAIVASLVIGLLGAKVDAVHRVLRRVEATIVTVGRSIGYVMVPLILALGIMIGVSFGVRLGVGHYAAISLYSFAMAVIWWLFYVFGPLRYVGGVRNLGPLLKQYYIPTALFAAGTSSSLVTIPVNLAFAKRYGVRDEVADFIIPVGSIVHKSASTMQYMAYMPFVAGYVFGMHIGWLQLLVLWPFIVLYAMAAPGVPGAMGLSLWTGVLVASLLGLSEPMRTTFVGTWVALVGGIPDMFRTSGNSTTDGFVAIIFSNVFDKYFAPASPVRVSAPVPHQHPEGRSHVISNSAIADHRVDSVAGAADGDGLGSTESTRAATYASHKSEP
jgi:Na+/H+-dicarboxylate symporter